MTAEQAEAHVGHRARLQPSGAAVTVERYAKGHCLVRFPGCNGNAKRWFPISKLRASTVFDAEDGVPTEAGAGDVGGQAEHELETGMNNGHGKNGQASTATPPPEAAPDRATASAAAEPDGLGPLIEQIRAVKGELAACDARIAEQQAVRAKLTGHLDDLRMRLIDAV
jgi:hypothetical protein